jgi:predicted nucleotidyltransferase
MDQGKLPRYDGPLHQPKNGPTIFEVAERTFGRRFANDTELRRFVNTKRRELKLNMALLDAGWNVQPKRMPKIQLRTADRLFRDFMDRVAESNHNTGFAYFVEKVLLFGSYLRREERVTDIDVCISYCLKTHALYRRKLRRLIRERHVDAEQGYRMTVREIDDFITGKHPRIHTSDEGTIRRLGVPYKVIYAIPQIKSFVRLIAETDDRINVTFLHEELYRRLAR